MNTQNLLFERSSEMPEGLYIELMNKLKIDFSGNKEKNTIVVLKSIPKHVQMTKQEMIQQIVKESVGWEDREAILMYITQKRLCISDLKNICMTRKLATMKINRKWVEQEEMLAARPGLRELLKGARSFPPVMTF